MVDVSTYVPSRETESNVSVLGRIMQVLVAVAGILLLAIVGVTVVDVCGRYFLNRPLPGGFELTEVMMALLIFVSLPVVTRENGHIKVDILDLVMPKGVRFYQEFVGNIVGAVCCLIVCWGMWAKSENLASYSSHTDTLHIPTSPVAYIITLMLLVTAIIFLMEAFRLVRNRRRERA